MEQLLLRGQEGLGAAAGLGQVRAHALNVPLATAGVALQAQFMPAQVHACILLRLVASHSSPPSFGAGVPYRAGGGAHDRAAGAPGDRRCEQQDVHRDPVCVRPYKGPGSPIGMSRPRSCCLFEHHCPRFACACACMCTYAAMSGGQEDSHVHEQGRMLQHAREWDLPSTRSASRCMQVGGPKWHTQHEWIEKLNLQVRWAAAPAAAPRHGSCTLQASRLAWHAMAPSRHHDAA